MLALFSRDVPPASESALAALGYEGLRLPPHPALPPPLATHPDMLLHFAPNAIITSPLYGALARRELERICAACKKPLLLTKAEPCGTYPGDILFNAVPVGKHLFCNPIGTASEVMEAYGAENVQAVRQGYAKCSVIPVSKDAIITSDPSIARRAEAVGIEVLAVSPMGIRLPGYDHGFWGGVASFAPYQNDNPLFFCGTLFAHPEGERIQSFCHAHGVLPVSLNAGEMIDVGTVFLI